MSYDYLFKLIIIGDTGTGKSSILCEFTDKRFNPVHDLTIGVEFGAKMVHLNEFKKDIKLQIWDAAGQEAFRSITRSYYRGAAGAFIVFDISKRESYLNVNRWLQELKSMSKNEIEIVLIGNKSDLNFRRAISFEEANQFAKENNITYFETSAKDYTSTQKAFMIITNNIYKSMLSNPNRFDQETIKGGFPQNYKIKNNESDIRCCTIS